MERFSGDRGTLTSVFSVNLNFAFHYYFPNPIGKNTKAN